MKKAIRILLVLALSVSLFAISVSASEEFEHPMPPQYLCHCDNPSPSGPEDRYRVAQDWSDDLFHCVLVYDVYMCINCDGYIYEFVKEHWELHTPQTGICRVCGYEN